MFFAHVPFYVCLYFAFLCDFFCTSLVYERKILDLVLGEILDLVLPKEHTDQSGPEPSTKNGRCEDARFFPWEMGGTFKNKRTLLQYFWQVLYLTVSILRGSAAGRV